MNRKKRNIWRTKYVPRRKRNLIYDCLSKVMKEIKEMILIWYECNVKQGLKPTKKQLLHFVYNLVLIYTSIIWYSSPPPYFSNFKFILLTSKFQFSIFSMLILLLLQLVWSFRWKVESMLGCFHFHNIWFQ